MAEEKVVDESWKAQVRKERETQEGKGVAPIADKPMGQLDLRHVVKPIYERIAVALGFVPDPRAGERVININEAMQYSLLLQTLYEKTRGNRTPEEENFFHEVLQDVSLGLGLASEKAKEIRAKQAKQAAQQMGIVPGH